MLCQKLSEENAKLRALAAERLAHNKTKNLLQDNYANKDLFFSTLQQKTAKTQYSTSSR